MKTDDALKYMLLFITHIMLPGVILLFLVTIAGDLYGALKHEWDCKELAPDGYEYNTDSTIIREKLPLTCHYESLPNRPYSSCELKYKDTKNHGRVILNNTCKEVNE